MRMADLTSSSFYADPYPAYKALQEEGNLISLMPAIWVTGSYEVTEKILRDKRWGKDFLEYVRMRYGAHRIHDSCFQMMHRSVIMMNPPEHSYMKGLLMKVFNAGPMAGILQQINTVAGELIDRVIGKPSFDLMEDFAIPFPLIVICRLLGLTEEEIQFFITDGPKLVQPYARIIDIAVMTEKQIQEANDSVATMAEFFNRKLNERRKSPGNDLISQLLFVEDNGSRLSEEEVIATLMLTFGAGHETTSHMIGNSLIALFQHPDQLALVRQDASRIPQCVSECLRYDTSLQITSRHALEDMEFEGIEFSEGETVIIFLGAVNRDPRRYSSPDRLNIERMDPAPRHLSFGAGAHYCVGGLLAVAELEVALRTIFHKLPKLEITNLDGLEWETMGIVRGVESLQATVHSSFETAGQQHVSIGGM